MQKHSLLLVDDEEIILATIGRDLQVEGYDVTLCKNGEEAIKSLMAKHFDVVITDLIMEEMNGIEVLKRAKEISNDTMVMVLTGFGSLSTAVDALRLGAADYMMKPCDRAELSVRVKNCLEKQRMQRKIRLYENILPICSMCKKIRDDSGVAPGEGRWVPVDEYIEKKTGIDVTHGYCPECSGKKEKEIDDLLK